jgi:predicted RNA binding protein YcfA (HicA-like mRNA interferase family)
MAKPEKLLTRILQGTSDANIPYRELCRLLERLGFQRRIRGDHHIFTREGVEEILNLQPKRAKAKPYQVKQVRNVIVEYRLAENEDAEAEEGSQET